MDTLIEKNKSKDTSGKRKIKIKRRKDSWQLYLMILPAVLAIGIFSYGPMGGLIMAFQDYKPFLGLRDSAWVGLEHFKFLFEYPHSKQVIWNTFRFGIIKLVIGIPVTLIFAILINEVRIKSIRNPIQAMVILPHFLSWVVLGGIFSEMLSPGGGIVNELITTFGFEPIFFLGENNWFVGTVVATDIWKTFGYGSIIFLASLSGVDPALYESAEMDGAGKWKQTLHITLPALIPTITLVTALNISLMLSTDFDQIFNLYNTLVYEKGDIIDTFVYRVGLVDGNYSFATAVGLFKSIVGLVMFVGAFKISEKLSGQKTF